MIGSLAIAGTLSPITAGYVVFGSALASGTLVCGVACTIGCGLGKEIAEKASHGPGTRYVGLRLKNPFKMA